MIRNSMLKRTLLVAIVGVMSVGANAQFSGDYAHPWTFMTTSGTSDASWIGDATFLEITGADDGSGNTDYATYTHLAVGTGMVDFTWAYDSTDVDQYDGGGYVVNGVFTFLAYNEDVPAGGPGSFAVNAGDTFGFFVFSDDSAFDPGILTITEFSAPQAIPEPATMAVLGLGLAGAIARRRRRA